MEQRETPADPGSELPAFCCSRQGDRTEKSIEEEVRQTVTGKDSDPGWGTAD